MEFGFSNRNGGGNLVTSSLRGCNKIGLEDKNTAGTVR